VPGLIDVHVHLQTPIRSILGGFNFVYFLDSLLGDFAPQRREFLEDGVTAIRDDGGPAARAFRLRSRLANHQLLGPRLFAVGRLVTSPHGHPVATIWSPSLARQGAILASTPVDLIASLEKNYAEGPPDAVKIIYGTIGIAKEKISPGLLEQAVAWAAHKRLISVVHIETAEEASSAVRAGATGIEHFATIESLPDSLVAAIVEHRTFLDPTFGELRTARALTGNKKEDVERELHEKCGFVRRAYDSGARLTVGTDAPLVPYGQGFLDELAEYAACGFTPPQILAFATINNAAYLGNENELGKIAPGYAADLLLVRQNPLESLSAVHKPLWVMLAGQVVVGEPRM
jgi:enamidase